VRAGSEHNKMSGMRGDKQHAVLFDLDGVLVDSWGIGSAEDLATSGADAVVDSPSQLPNAVSDMLLRIS
jgi:phosphoglycolate phosphatase-like HAD superfamily hydrolase